MCNHQGLVPFSNGGAKVRQINQEIADILRSSITTIYTYRSKLKAKAINKGTFEDDIRQISTY